MEVARDEQSALGSRDDDELMRLAKAGVDAAFDVLVRRHQARVLRLCARGIGDTALARDVAQATFVELHRCLARYEPRNCFRAYLARIAINCCAMTGRAQQAQRRRDERATMAEPNPPPDDLMIAKDRLRDLDAALATLSEKLRTVVVMRYAGELSLEEIAIALELPIGTVKSRLFAGLEKMRTALENHERS